MVLRVRSRSGGDDDAAGVVGGGKRVAQLARHKLGPQCPTDQEPTLTIAKDPRPTMPALEDAVVRASPFSTCHAGGRAAVLARSLPANAPPLAMLHLLLNALVHLERLKGSKSLAQA